MPFHAESACNFPGHFRLFYCVKEAKTVSSTQLSVRRNPVRILLSATAVKLPSRCVVGAAQRQKREKTPANWGQAKVEIRGSVRETPSHSRLDAAIYAALRVFRVGWKLLQESEESQIVSVQISKKAPRNYQPQGVSPMPLTLTKS
ncbi:hypothetical protein DSM3645_21624 [Blastopirellula marina DSM 3645]|uniref:Uncharacterized protein n=1 Tax=Blastopirellula marina DSM 3645 TaxID=314230 RepID=A3ZU81_9BACT|nr:hypothetical protein DSM3645_21624 [Blastopirellula marina DSM 3645]